jgi:hypothetical protein
LLESFKKWDGTNIEVLQYSQPHICAILLNHEFVINSFFVCYSSLNKDIVELPHFQTSKLIAIFLSVIDKHGV